MKLDQYWKMDDKELEQAATLVTEYLRLVYKYSEIKRSSGADWKPEYERNEKDLKARITELRNQMDMEPIN